MCIVPKTDKPATIMPVPTEPPKPAPDPVEVKKPSKFNTNRLGRSSLRIDLATPRKAPQTGVTV